MTFKARIAKVQHECRTCSGQIMPGQIYRDECRRDPHNPTRFINKRTCASCVNHAGDPHAVAWLLRQMRNRDLQTIRDIGKTYPQDEGGATEPQFPGRKVYERWLEDYLRHRRGPEGLVCFQQGWIHRDRFRKERP